MTEQELVRELSGMGIDANSYRLVALLPLVQVAWADGEVQPAERALIEAVAAKYALADEAGRALLHTWLEREPSQFYLHRGRKILRELMTRHHEFGDVGLDLVQDIVGLCDGVAEAAGGLFGFVGRRSATEKQAIEEIVGGLGVGTTKHWKDLVADLKG